ncbi:thiamine phosphate synthase [Geminicoccaceae bacterium 1502E]|nr:thiamine phosphate synthase [Geminicoccaceae bacterium 1502E]
MAVILPRFYPILDSAAWLARALPLGVRLAQLRIKSPDEAVLRREIRAGLALARRHGAALVVNDHWRIAIEEGARWLHLGQEDLDSADLPAIRRAGLELGISTHDHAELDRALAFSPGYVALGPVHPTILKPMRWAPQGLERVREWKRLAGHTPLCAIGGMSVERAPAAFAAGADMVAAATDVTLHPDPEARMRRWLEVCG